MCHHHPTPAVRVHDSLTLPGGITGDISPSLRTADQKEVK